MPFLQTKTENLIKQYDNSGVSDLLDDVITQGNELLELDEIVINETQKGNFDSREIYKSVKRMRVLSKEWSNIFGIHMNFRKDLRTSAKTKIKGGTLSAKYIKSKVQDSIIDLSDHAGVLALIRKRIEKLIDTCDGSNECYEKLVSQVKFFEFSVKKIQLSILPKFTRRLTTVVG